MIVRPMQVRALFGVFLLYFSVTFAQIPGNYTLTSNQTFTSTSGTFMIGGSGNTFNLQTFTATFTGTGNFDINSRITGSGSVMIDLTDPNKVVQYDAIGAGNSYGGLTTVRSGILLLETPAGGNSGVKGNLSIGGGPNLARVTRNDHDNRELIADTSTITIAANGTLEFNRAFSGNSSANDSQETFRKLVLDGGTLLNFSSSTRLTTVNILSSVQLLSSSTIDLGVAMTMNIGDVNTAAWTPGAILTIKNWSTDEPIYVGQITAQQLGQIRFELPSGTFNATQIADGQIIPTTMVPEASAFLFIPLLVGAAIWPELRKGRQSRRA